MVAGKFNKRAILLALGLLLVLLVFGPAVPAHAQTYRFSLPVYEVEAYIEEDGSVTLYYYMVFQNDPSASPIDYVDLALPYANYNLRDIVATIDGQPMPEVNDSADVAGAELALGNLAIQPGQQGTVIATVPGITDILFPYDQDDREDFVNFQFTPNYFGSQYDRSQNTAYRMTIVLPPAVAGEEGVYYIPRNWPGEDISEASFTTDGRVYYSWFTNNANVHTEYEFGTAFPASAVPVGAIADPDDYEQPSPPSGGSGSGLGGLFTGLLSSLPCAIPILAIIGVAVFARKSQQKQTTARKLQYFPPKLAVDGKGIRRGLTAVEAGILLEEPLDKVLTMILFGLLKKEAIKVVEKEPLKVEAIQPLPEGLYAYESEFIKSFSAPAKNQQRKALQAMLIQLVDDISEKLKGFSPAETKAYYTDIVRRAWLAVEGAETPEIKSAQFDHTLEWTMLDNQFDNRTQQTFINTPVFLPRWWGLYNPGFAAAPSAGTTGLASPATSTSGSGGSKPSFSMPNIPGSDFAASIINGTAAVSSGIIGDLTGFTSGVTNRTNPIPISRPSSGSSGFRGGGGGSSCACACACAGCACACAGGGR